ncbi:MAG: hypothetical protein AAGJ32_02895 [Pseudomonadota bacterium]
MNPSVQTAAPSRMKSLGLIGATLGHGVDMARRSGVWILAGWIVLTAFKFSGVGGAWTGVILALGTAMLTGVVLARHYETATVKTTLRVVGASVLVTLVLGFFLLLSTMVGGFVSFAVMAGSGFDFDAAGTGPEAFRKTFDAFLETPGGQLSQAAFWLSMAVWLVSAGRALPYAAATARDGRVVALEAFNRSRGSGLLYTVLLVLAVLPSIIALVSVQISDLGAAEPVVRATGLAWAAFGLAAASAAVPGDAPASDKSEDGRASSESG